MEPFEKSGLDWTVTEDIKLLHKYDERQLKQVIPAVRGMMCKRIPNVLRIELVDDRLSKTPERIIQDVRDRFTGNIENMNSSLETQAQNTTFN